MIEFCFFVLYWIFLALCVHDPRDYTVLRQRRLIVVTDLHQKRLSNKKYENKANEEHKVTLLDTKTKHKIKSRMKEVTINIF